jgi:hypothetical protein
MKNNKLKKISPLSLVLMGVSLITTLTIAMTPSNNNGSVARFDGDGEAFLSSLGEGETVHWAVGGDRSWTLTGPPGVNLDNLSATSSDDAGTFTYSYISGATFGGTSADQ